MSGPTGSKLRHRSVTSEPVSIFTSALPGRSPGGPACLSSLRVSPPVPTGQRLGPDRGANRLGVLLASSLVIVQPGQTKVVRFFGTYVGTIRRPGLWWIVPLADRRNLSIRVRNFETNRLKVNDAEGNPVEIAAIVVWQVADTAEAVYAVDDYVNFVQVQAESALRHVATTRPYDDPNGDGTSLRGSTDLVAGELAQEMAERMAIAGVEIIEVRISHLAYASEIAQAMLRRQQANAVVAARSRIVDGAVGMVDMALSRRDERGIVQLDEERKAAMVSNLMVVLCGDQPPSPVVNTGTLYT